MEIGNLDIGKL